VRVGLAIAGILILFTVMLTWIAVIPGLSAKSADGVKPAVWRRSRRSTARSIGSPPFGARGWGVALMRDERLQPG
jgi:hypothetical protein